MVLDVRHLRRRVGPLGPVGLVLNARLVSLDGGDFEDPRGFVWHAVTIGSYIYRPFEAEVDLGIAITMTGTSPLVAGGLVLSEAVRQGAGLKILVANI